MTATAKLPVWATVFAAWRYLATQWRIVLPLAALLLLIAPAALLFWPAALGPVIRPFSTTPLFFLFFLETVLRELPLFALAAIAIVPLHQAILTGPPQSGWRIPFRIGRREAQYFLLAAALSVVFMASEFAILPAIDAIFARLVNLALTADRDGSDMELLMILGTMILGIPVVIALIYALNRFSLALPAIAIDRGGPLLHAWRISRGNGWRLVAVLLIAILPLLVAGVAYELSNKTVYSEIPVTTADGTLIFMPEERSLSSILFGFAWDTLKFSALSLIGGAALSMSYRALGGMDEAPKASP